jgi:uncharacterized cupin superfamily protein
MPRLTPAELDALETALAKATPGEWSVDSYGNLNTAIGTQIHFRGIRIPMTFGPAMEQAAANVEATALAHNALPLLIAAARATVPEVMRGRHSNDALWELEYQRRYKRFHLCVWEGLNGKWHWMATRSDLCYRSGEADTLAAAQSSAVAWVDQQEGK